MILWWMGTNIIRTISDQLMVGAIPVNDVSACWGVEFFSGDCVFESTNSENLKKIDVLIEVLVLFLL